MSDLLDMIETLCNFSILCRPDKKAFASKKARVVRLNVSLEELEQAL